MPGFERRVGERFEVGDIKVLWTVPKGARPKRAERKLLGERATTAHLRNVSMSGAGILAVPNDSLAPGSPVEVHLDEETYFIGRIKRVLPTLDDAWKFYGILYLEVSPNYQLWLNTIVNYQRVHLTEKSWRKAL